MPVALGEWRVRIGRFIHWVRENDIREQQVKVLTERIRRLKLLNKRLLEKKEESEDKCESKQDDLSAKVNYVPNESSIINNNTPTGSHKGDSCSSSESTIEENNTQTESTTNKKSNGDDSIFPFFFTLLLSFFSLLFSLICFFVVDFFNLLESYKPFLKWSGESSWRSTCLRVIVCSTLAYIVFACVINTNENVQNNLVIIGDENAKAECFIEANETPTESTNKPNNTTNESTKECNNFPTNTTFKANNTPSTTRDGPPESKHSKTKTSKRKTIKEKNATTKLTITENSTLPESAIKNSIAPKEFHIDTPSTMTDKPSKRKKSRRKFTKEKKTANESTYNSHSAITETSIRANNSPTKSNINKDNNAQTKSTIKENNFPAESLAKDNNTLNGSAIKDSNTPSTIKEKSSKRKISRRKTAKDKNIANESHLKDNTTTTGSTIKEKISSTEYVIEYNSISTEFAFKENNAASESTIKIEKTTYGRTINCNDTTTESTIKDRNSTTESTIKDHNRSCEPTIKDTNIPIEPTIKYHNTRIEPSIKDNTSTIHCTFKEKNTPTKFPIKGNNSTSESTIKYSNTTNDPAITQNHTPSRTPPEENNQLMGGNIAQAENTVRSRTQKLLLDVKHGLSSQIPSSPKGTTDGPVMQESTCLPEMLLVTAGDVELNPGPFDRSSNIQEQELVNLAYEVPSSKYTELCIALDVSYNQSQTILDSHLLDFTRSLNAVFFKWKDRQRDGTDCREVIAAALRGVYLGRLGDKMSGGGYLPQEAALTESAVGEETQPLTKDQVNQCAQDFKTFYRTRLCKIKTDPLDFNSILEFERIYTNLVLLRNEMGTTRKTPLDYTKLLTTKVNAEFPKRLMVEGEGGAGKTTFCSKIAWDWAKGTKEFEDFDWVLVIPFRNTKAGQTVGDIAKTYLSDSNTVLSHQIDKYILSAPLKVLIIFDGLDEYAGDILKESSDFAKIIRSEKFVECRVLVTTRPWTAVPFKFHERMMQTFAFLAVAGFDKKNISTYVTKYFQDEPPAGYELIKYIESNDLIQENMAPFPLYIAMLCILWRNSDADKRNIIRKLKTFSQLFTAMIIFLKDHCLTKQHQNHNVKILTSKEINKYLLQIGKFAYSGVLKKRLTYTEKDFSGYDEAMEACCRIGVLSREILMVPRQDRRLSETDPVTWSVFFPHKLFQEYLVGMYLASLFESDHERYEEAVSVVIQRAEEFRDLLYFTVSQTKKVAIDVTNMLINMTSTGIAKHTIVDIAFEACDEDVAKVVRQQLFGKQKTLKIDDNMSAHTVSGYLFIMEEIQMETLILNRRSFGPTVSRDLADVICSSTALTSLAFSGAKFHADFYGILEGKVKTLKIERLSLELMNISDEHISSNLARFVNNLHRLKDLTLRDNNFDGRFYTELAYRACSVEIEKVCIENCNLRGNDPTSSRDLARFLCLLPCLTYLTIKDSDSSNNRLYLHNDFYHELAQASSSKIENVCIEGCNLRENDPTSSRDLARFLCLLPCLTYLTIKDSDSSNKRLYLRNDFYHELARQASSSKIKNVYFGSCNLSRNDTTSSRDLARFLCLLPCLTDLTIKDSDSQYTQFLLLDDFYHELARQAPSSKIEKVCIENCNLHGNDPTSSRDLARFLCLLPCLTYLTIKDSDSSKKRLYIRNDFYHELAQVSSSKIENVCIEGCNLRENDLTSSRDLARFLCLLPCLTYLTIKNSDSSNKRLYLRNDFYHELAQASSSKIKNVYIESCNLRENNPTSARDLARFLCLLPCLTDLTIKDSGSKYKQLFLLDDFYHELARQAPSSKIEKVCIHGCYLGESNPTASRDLARFLCLLPCLADLRIKDSGGQYETMSLHDDFYHELARQASSSKIEKVNDPISSRDLSRFLCFLPCLTDLTIQDSEDQGRYLGDDFSHELARQASSLKIEKVCIGGFDLHGNEPTASRDLARFLCLLPCLTDLTIKDSGERNGYLSDDFYHELARQASSSKIEKVCIEDCDLRRYDPTASRDLARFLCLLPCLTDLTIKDSGDQDGYLSDDFYHELARQASSSKIEKVCINGCDIRGNDPTASRDLARFLCLLPCLTDLTIKESGGQYQSPYLHDGFYHELARQASSSKNYFFKKKLHLDERLEELNEKDLKQQIEYIRHLVHHTLSEKTSRPTSRAHEPRSYHQGSVQQQIEYPAFVTPPGCPQHCETSQLEHISGQKAGTVAESDLDVPSTSGVNAQSGKIYEGPSAVTPGHLQPKHPK